jgi:hypothetical protein
VKDCLDKKLPWEDKPVSPAVLFLSLFELLTRSEVLADEIGEKGTFVLCRRKINAVLNCCRADVLNVSPRVLRWTAAAVALSMLLCGGLLLPTISPPPPLLLSVVKVCPIIVAVVAVLSPARAVVRAVAVAAAVSVSMMAAETATLLPTSASIASIMPKLFITVRAYARLGAR